MNIGDDYDNNGDNGGEDAGIVMALGEVRLGIYNIQTHYLTSIPSPLSSKFIKLSSVEPQETDPMTSKGRILGDNTR